MTSPGETTTATVTWVGHATLLIEVDGYRIITDPALTSRLAHLRRRRPTPDIAEVDALLLSHIHMDHLHLPSLRRVVPTDRILVPAGARSLLPRFLRRTATETGTVVSPTVFDVRAGDRISVRDGDVPVTIEVVHAEHSSRRGPHSRVVADPVGYVVRIGSASIYFAGDTDLFAAMRDIDAIDLAFIPIWGWGPSLGEKHLDPVSAAMATSWIDPRHVVPIHWGTYSPIRAGRGDPPWLERPVGAFREALDDLGLVDRLQSVEPGGSVTIAV